MATDGAIAEVLASLRVTQLSNADVVFNIRKIYLNLFKFEWS